MIRGIGIDLVRGSRLEHWIENPALMRRYFHPAEIGETMKRGVNVLLACAARFAAKEALGKALGTGLRGFALREVEVKNDAFGKPMFVLHGKAVTALRRIGGTRLHLSISYEDDHAIAMAIIEDGAD